MTKFTVKDLMKLFLDENMDAELFVETNDNTRVKVSGLEYDSRYELTIKLTDDVYSADEYDKACESENEGALT